MVCGESSARSVATKGESVLAGIANMNDDDDGDDGDDDYDEEKEVEGTTWGRGRCPPAEDAVQVEVSERRAKLLEVSFDSGSQTLCPFLIFAPPLQALRSPIGQAGNDRVVI